MAYTIEDWIDGEPELGIMTIEDAEPFLEFWIDQAISEIEYQTGVEYDKYDFETRLSDREWMYAINNNDDPDEIDMEQAWEEIEDLTYKIIKEIKDEQEEETSVSECRLPTTKAKMPK